MACPCLIARTRIISLPSTWVQTKRKKSDGGPLVPSEQEATPSLWVRQLWVIISLRESSNGPCGTHRKKQGTHPRPKPQFDAFKTTCQRSDVVTLGGFDTISTHLNSSSKCTGPATCTRNNEKTPQLLQSSEMAPKIHAVTHLMQRMGAVADPKTIASAPVSVTPTGGPNRDFFFCFSSRCRALSPDTASKTKPNCMDWQLATAELNTNWKRRSQTVWWTSDTCTKLHGGTDPC